jgi:hypothetical protein
MYSLLLSGKPTSSIFSTYASKNVKDKYWTFRLVFYIKVYRDLRTNVVRARTTSQSCRQLVQRKTFCSPLYINGHI